MLDTKFYICEHCGNIVRKVKDSGVPVVCCGEKMKELEPKTADAAGEKHVPLIKVEGSDVTVTVGSTLHPMTDEHYIAWVYLETAKGGQYHAFEPGETPVCSFKLAEGEELKAAYEYCTIHGLWKAEA